MMNSAPSLRLVTILIFFPLHQNFVNRFSMQGLATVGKLVCGFSSYREKSSRISYSPRSNLERKEKIYNTL